MLAIARSSAAGSVMLRAEVQGGSTQTSLLTETRYNKINVGLKVGQFTTPKGRSLASQKYQWFRVINTRDRAVFRVIGLVLEYVYC